MYDMFNRLTDLIDRRRAWDAWDTLNGLVNEVYGIDIGDALDAYEEKMKKEEGAEC